MTVQNAFDSDVNGGASLFLIDWATVFAFVSDVNRGVSLLT